MDEQLPELADVRRAARAIADTVLRTPLLPLPALRSKAASPIWIKAENLQRTGAFKLRGALNAIQRLTPEQRQKGVVASSAGNHAQGVALAAAAAGVPATIVMPKSAPMIKVEATRAYGAEVLLAGDSFDQADRVAQQLQAERGAYLLHPFDDVDVIAGQGTIALEILEQIERPAAIVVPVGGGGLISGIALTVKALRPDVRVIGVQAAGSDAMYRSVRAGRVVNADTVRTIADGLAVKDPRRRTFRAIQRWVDELVIVPEDEIAAAILMMLERGKMVVEGAGAVAVAALHYGHVSGLNGPAVAVVSGGNIDVNVISRIIERGLVADGRYMRLSTIMADRPGSLNQLLAIVARLGANVVTVGHERLDPGVPLGETEVRLVVETRNRQHGAELISAVNAAGIRCTQLTP